jgi:melibiose permease
MFVSQTVFLADIVDYGEVKMGYRAESITFSMKGFLQKMAYTIQTIILFSGLGISNYSPDNKYTTLTAKTTTFMMLVVPIIFMALSIIVFSTKFKLHGEYMEEITAEVDKRKAERAATNN